MVGVVAHVEDAVVAIQIGWHEEHVDPASCRVVQFEFPETAHDDIVVVHQIVAGLGGVGVSVSAQFGEKLLVRAVVARRNHHEGQDMASGALFGIDPAERVEEDVDTFVAVFVAAADGDQQVVVIEVLTGHGRGHLQQFGAGRGAAFVIMRFIGREAVFEAVGRDDVARAAEELLALEGRDLADGREYVGSRGGRLLKRMAGHDAVLVGQPVSVQVLESVVKRDVLPGYATADDRGVRGEDRADGEIRHLEVEQAGAGHPFVELGDDLVVRLDTVAHETLDHLSGRITEEGRFDIIPAAADGVHAEALPELGQDLVLVPDEGREVDQDGHRLSGDVPVADAEAEPLFRRGHAPRAEQHRIFLEFRVLAYVAPDIRTDMDMVVFLE